MYKQTFGSKFASKIQVRTMPQESKTQEMLAKRRRSNLSFFSRIVVVKGQGLVGKESLLFMLQKAISSYVCNVNNKGRNSMALQEMQSKLKLAKQIGSGLTVCTCICGIKTTIIIPILRFWLLKYLKPQVWKVNFVINQCYCNSKSQYSIQTYLPE